MRIKLNDVTVANLKPGSCCDTTLPSFGVRVGKNARTFIVVKDGVRNKLGRNPALTLADARQKALEQIYGRQIRRRVEITYASPER